MHPKRQRKVELGLCSKLEEAHSLAAKKKAHLQSCGGQRGRGQAGGTLQGHLKRQRRDSEKRAGDSQPCAVEGSARASEVPLSPSITESRPANAWEEAATKAGLRICRIRAIRASDLDLNLIAVAVMLPVRNGGTANKEAATALAMPLQTSTLVLVPRSRGYWPWPPMTTQTICLWLIPGGFFLARSRRLGIFCSLA